ncbi:hypothetical protein CR513_09917, partial [Mucuna pruriens]
MDKTPAAARHLISNMASNRQQFGIKGANNPLIMNKIAVVQHQPSITARVCGLCTSVEHPTDMCHTLQETKSDHPESVGAIDVVWKATILARAESRAVCSSAIWIHPDWISRANKLSTTDSIISGTIVPTTTIENASSRKFTISRGLDEAISS